MLRKLAVGSGIRKVTWVVPSGRFLIRISGSVAGSWYRPKHEGELQGPTSKGTPRNICFTGSCQKGWPRGKQHIIIRPAGACKHGPGEVGRGVFITAPNETQNTQVGGACRRGHGRGGLRNQCRTTPSQQFQLLEPHAVLCI